MTYNTFTFKTEAQMLLFIRMQEDNGTALFDKLKKKGCTRFCLNQIWNVKGTFKTSILFEYESPNAFKQCQIELENFTKNLMKEIEAADPVIEASRNIVLQDLRVQLFALLSFLKLLYRYLIKYNSDFINPPECLCMRQQDD